MTESQYQELAQRTLNAQKANREIPIISKEYPELTRAEGYHIQALREQLVLAEGHRLVGYKMGATSLAKRRQMGSKMPSYGRLFEHYQLSEGRFKLDHFIHPKLESEITFVLGKELKGPFVSVPDVLSATKYIVPSFEIIDSRYENFKFIASFMAYGEAKRCSKHPEEYGRGCPEAVAASESANNGVTGATLIPMLTLGIPGDVITAVLMGALMIQGLNPGPQLFTQHADMTYTVIVGFLIVNILMLYMGKLAIRAFGQVCKVPYLVLLPVVLAFCLVGAYACSNSIYDCLIAIVFGVIGYLAEKFDFSTTPMLIGLVLGSLAEQNLIRTLTSSQGSLSVFVQRPISLLFIILTVLFVGYNLYSRHKQKKLERAISNN